MTVISYHSEEGESEVQGDEWEDVAKVFVDVAESGSGEYIIWASCEYAGVSLNKIVAVRILIDDVEVAIDHFKSVLANQFRTFSTMGLKHWEKVEGFHWLKLQAKCADPTQTVKVRRKRLLVMKH